MLNGERGKGGGGTGSLRGQEEKIPVVRRKGNGRRKEIGEEGEGTDPPDFSWCGKKTIVFFRSRGRDRGGKIPLVHPS